MKNITYHPIMNRKILLLLVMFCALLLNTSAQTWVVKAPIPDKINSSGAALVGDTIYVVGGQDTTLNEITVYAYDITSNTWTAKSPMPTPRGELAVAAVNGKIYAIGGYNSNISSPVNTVEEFDPSTNTWTTKTTYKNAKDC